MAVDLSEMRDKFIDDELRMAMAIPVGMSHDAWHLLVVLKNGSHEFMTVARTPRLKVYKTLEAAFEDVKRVGFPKMEIRASVGDLKVA